MRIFAFLFLALAPSFSGILSLGLLCLRFVAFRACLRLGSGLRSGGGPIPLPLIVLFYPFVPGLGPFLGWPSLMRLRLGVVSCSSRPMGLAKRAPHGALFVDPETLAALPGPQFLHDVRRNALQEANVS